NPFSDPVRAKEQALALAASGADYILAAAAAGNFGVFEAAAQQGFRAFGLDVDQCGEAPGFIVDSLIKRVDLVIQEAVDAVLSGSEERLLVFGLASRGLELVALSERPEAHPDCLILRHPEIIERVRELGHKVIAGEIGIADPMGLL
ncbi:MAG: BMP family ABC transporter substrate-binding protein, partial [Thermoanaerobaculia bacterium]